jgi:GTP pyrophosphokinase
MHDHAERGVAAHWMYKEAKASDAALESRVSMMRNWLSQEVATHEVDADEVEYEAQRIYVLTPQNKVIELSAGATPVDFAYAVHSSVGDRCRGAKINGQMATLTRKLESGDVVEIITAKQGGPSRDWLNVSSGYVTTSKARNRIKHWFKLQDYEEDLHEGRAALDRECHRAQIPKVELDQLAKRFNFKNVDDLYAAIGRGDVSAIQVANTLQPKVHETAEEVDEKIRKRTKKPAKPDGSSGPVIVGGVNDLMTHVARCCKPVPPDPVIGFITRGRGITVHHQDCRVVDRIDVTDRDRLIDVAWNAHSTQRHYVVDILVEAYDRKGLLRDITSVFTHADVDVLAVKTRSDKRHERAKMRFSVEIAELAELERVMNQLAQVPDVQSVGRQV